MTDTNVKSLSQLAMEIITQVCGPVDPLSVDPTGDGHVVTEEQAAQIGEALVAAGYTATQDSGLFAQWVKGEVEIVVESVDDEDSDDEGAQLLILNFVTY